MKTKKLFCILFALTILLSLGVSNFAFIDQELPEYGFSGGIAGVIYADKLIGLGTDEVRITNCTNTGSITTPNYTSEKPHTDPFIGVYYKDAEAFGEK